MKPFKSIFMILLTIFALTLAFVKPASSALRESKDKNILRLATTTSTENTGLLAYLLPFFEKEYKVKTHVIAVGTGKALKIAGNGDVDAVLVHDPEAEEVFVASGFGIDRKRVMHNDFIIAGPKEDPAGAGSAKSASEAFGKIAGREHSFISRGDDSGTHSKEKKIWKRAGIKPDGKWYLEIGKGMGAALTMASEKQAYTLSDRGTYLSMRKNLNLSIVYEGGGELMNVYHIIAVNPKKNKNVNYNLSNKFANWLVSERAQKLIGDFKTDGNVLFTPSAAKKKSRIKKK